MNIDSLKKVITYNNTNVGLEKEDALFKVLDYYYRGSGKNLDSLFYFAKVFEPYIHKSKRLKLRSDLKYFQAVSLFQKDASATFQLLRECLKDYKKIKDDFSIGKTYYRLGYFLGKLGKHQEKKNHILKAIEYLNKAPARDELFYIFNSYVGLCSTNMEMGFFTEAMDAALRSKQLAIEHQSIKRQLSAAINLSALYGNLSLEELNYGTSADRKKYAELSHENALEAYTLAAKIKSPKYACLTSYNLGLHYSEIKDWISSNKYLDECIVIAKRNKRYNDLFSAYDIKGDNYRAIAKTDSSDYCIYQAYDAAQQSMSVDIKIKAEHAMVQLLMEKGLYKEAIRKAKNGLALAQQSDNRRRKQAAYFSLYELYKKTKQNDLAFSNYEKYNVIKDSIVNEQTIKDIEGLKNKYENAEKEKQIAQLQQLQLSQALNFQKKLSLAVGIIFLMLISGLFYFFNSRNRLLKNQQKAIELEQRLLRSQMNPHFTFNALSSIQTYLLKSGQAQKGAYYLAKFAKLMRQILSQSRTSFISIDEEIQTLENYLSLQQLRYDDSFDYKINIDQSIDTESIQIPPMMIQPILENAIEHGKIYTQKQGKVKVDIKQQGEFLMVEVEDNGVGRIAATSIRAKEYESISMDIIEERLAILRKDYDPKINFKIQDPKEGGTSVCFTLPLINQYN